MWARSSKQRKAAVRRKQEYKLAHQAALKALADEAGRIASCKPKKLKRRVVKKLSRSQMN